MSSPCSSRRRFLQGGAAALTTVTALTATTADDPKPGQNPTLINVSFHTPRQQGKSAGSLSIRAEQTKRRCIMLENCCYGENETLVLNMARAGLFGANSQGFAYCRSVVTLGNIRVKCCYPNHVH